MAISILTAEDFLYVADRGTAKLRINPDNNTGDVEMFERIVPFNATGSSLPDFTKVPGVFPPNENGEHEVSPIRLGSLYQALAFRRGTIAAGSSPEEDDFPQAVGRVELPSILVEANLPLLTACANVPQLKLSQNINALRAALATGAQATRVLLLVGNEKPELFDTGQGRVPRFGASGSVPVALGSSRVAARIHRVDAPSNTSFAEIDQITPSDSYWFIALVWTREGHWDFAWSEEGVGEPLEQTALKRKIAVEVRQLTCVNDDSFEDDAIFKLTLEDRGGQAIKTDRYTWYDMGTGEIDTSPRLSLKWSSDEGSEPFAISISAEDANHGEAKLLPFPVGDGAHFNERQIRITGIAGLPGGGAQPVFYADVKVTVSYG